MNTEKILLKTQQQIREYQSHGRRNRYPESIKEAIATLSQKIPATQLSSKLGISKTFIYKCSKNFDSNKTKKLIKKEIPVDNLRLQDITHQLKSFVKEEKVRSDPTMRFTTKSGILIEIF